MVNFDALNLDLSYWAPLLAIVAAGEIMRGYLAQFNCINLFGQRLVTRCKVHPEICRPALIGIGGYERRGAFA